MPKQQKKEIDRITYHEEPISFGNKNWRCHIFTKDGSHYEGEGYSKEGAKSAAMDVYEANKYN